MLYGIHIVQDRRLSNRNHGVIMRMVAYLLALKHKTENVIKHFTGGPETTPLIGGYRFSPRSKKYLAWKQKRYPGRPLLVLTGRLMAAALAGTVTATQWKWTYRALSPHAIENRRRKAAGQKALARDEGPKLADWLREEVEVMSPREIQEMCRLAERSYARLADKPYYQRRRKLVINSAMIAAA